MTDLLCPQDEIERSLSLQKEEWEVLESIYPDYLSGDISKGSITIEVPVELSGLKTLELSLEPKSEDARRCPPIQLSVSTLPPVLLTFTLPQDYPLHHPPQLTSCHTAHSWIPRHKLLDKLLALWQLGEGVLYSWIEWIRSGELLDALGLVDHSNSHIRLFHPTPHLLAPILAEYDSSRAAARFSETSYACTVCLTSVKGARCILLSCTHVFCRTCLQDFWQLCIAEGDVGRVGCPDPACVKENREATEEEVRRVVTEDEVARWKWLCEKRRLEKDPTIIHCPVAVCQTPVPAPAGASAEDGGWERLRTCHNCGYSFCAFCRRTWHGPITECPLSMKDEFVLEYMAMPEGSHGRLVLERRYGRANLMRMVARVEEDRANREWFENSTMACPYCHVRVQKSMGCNHMTCAKCNHHFCYRCGDKLDPANPYKHFSTPGYRCYSKLFDFQETADDGWQPMVGFDVL